MRRSKKIEPTVASPCVKVCKLEKDTCIGCGRTKDEISKWLAMSDEQRQSVLDRIHNV